MSKADEEDKASSISELLVDSSEISSIKNIEAKDCTITNVTVFNDRAEVTRSIKLQLSKGNHSVVVSGLSQYVDKDSIRISGGTGKATILEVSVEGKQLTTTEINASIQKERREREKLDDERTRLNEKLARINKESQWLEGWSKAALGQNGNGKSGPTPLDLMSPDSLQKTSQFLDFYQERLAKIDEQKFILNKELKVLNDQISVIDSEIAKKQYPGRSRLEVTVTLQITEQCEVHLQLSYIVLNAIWIPSYDCRVSSADDTLQLMYYGQISNSTGEDWNNVHISLSTAKPSVGGAPSALNTAKIYFKEHVSYQPPPTSAISHTHGWSASPHNQFFQAQNVLDGVSLREEEYGGMPPPPQVQVLTATAIEGASSTTFNIPRLATIQSDGKPHKVSITVVSDLKAKFTYTAIPSKSANVYLKATVLNSTTNYPFLAGSIQVFMDNNFVTTSSIKNVFPQEEFALYLGTDAGIKVVYRPPKKLTEIHGMVKRTNFQTVQCNTIIKNTKNIEVGVAVYDQLPLSNDEKIKVKLVEPVLKEKDPFCLLNSFNNMEWRVKIAPGGKVEIPFTYTIEWPVDKEVTTVDS